MKEIETFSKTKIQYILQLLQQFFSQGTTPVEDADRQNKTVRTKNRLLI